MVNVLIYGAGAIGSFVGYLLSELKEDEGKCGDEGKEKDKSRGEGRAECRAIENVALLGRKSHMQRIQEDGLKIKFPEGSKSIRFKHCLSRLLEIEELEFTPDVVVVCVKTHSLPAVLDEITTSGLLNVRLKDSVILLLMNGMGNREMFDLPSHEAFEGITSIGVVFSENGIVELKGKGKTILESRLPEGVKDFFQEMLSEKGFELELTDEFKVHQWNKLFANAVINPITALTRGQNGIVLSSCLEGIVEKIVEECVGVARLGGLEFEESGVKDFVYSVASKTSLNTSSMLQDILKGKKTEIDSINGYVVRLAKKHSLSVPVNETMYALIKTLENEKSHEKRREK